MKIIHDLALALVFTMTTLLTPNIFAATVKIIVTDTEGNNVKDAVVYALPKNQKTADPAEKPKTVIDQRDKEFIPYVSVFTAGTKVFFPNHDKIRHHVYSFSPAKKFEIPLYKGTPAQPIIFDQPGVVVLGCNIHDWMSAYIFVSETPHYSITDTDGHAAIENLPDGDYNIQVWHPKLKGKPELTAQPITLGADDKQDLNFTIVQKPVWRPFRPPSNAMGGYR